MQDEKKSKKVEMKRMRAVVKKSEPHTEEEKKKRKFTERNIKDAFRRVDAMNWQDKNLEKK